MFTASTFSHIANFHRPYLRAFHDLGWQVHVACGGAAAPIPEADRIFSLPLEKKMTAPQNFLAQRQLRRLLAENDYALVCAHTSLAAFFTRRAAAFCPRRPPLVNVVHGYLFDDKTPPLRRAVLLAAEKWTAPQTDLLLAMNRWDFALAKREGLSRDVRLIPGMGVDATRFDGAPAVSRGALRQRLGLSPSDFALIYPAEFSARKNQSLLIRGLSDLPEEVKLILPGQGAQLEECRALARQLRMENRIVFPGQIADLYPWFSAADAAVSSSRSEGLPFNVMEAMCCRLPVAVSRVKGHTDLIRDGETGLLFSRDDADGFAGCVRRLQNDAALAARLAAAGRDAVRPYLLPAVLPQVMDAYLSAAGAEARPAAETRAAGVR